MTRVGYWTSVAGVGDIENVPVIIASPQYSPELEAALGDRFISEFYGLRAGALLTLYVERGLWERFLRSSR
jgi:hypothetical protein